MGKSKLGLFSVLLVISVLWKPAYTSECSTSCKGKASSPGLAANTKYNYGVEGTVSVYLTGSSDNKETSVKLLGQVSVTSLGDCGHELVVQNLGISGPDGKKYSSPPGIEKPVRFSMQDGRLSPEICASEGDTRRSLNIKRAIISLLQTEQKSTTQVDIFGACPTEISQSAEGSSALVHRTRDLARCSHREQGQNELVSSVLNEDAEIKESQVLQSTIHVESKVNNGVPEKVSASEEYLYKPFSVGENGARAKVHTKLTLSGKEAGNAGPSNCNVQRTIIFEAPHGSPLQNNVNSALAAVKDTAKAIDKQASEKSAGNFASLIRIFRVTSKDDLIKVYNQVKGNNFERRVYLDGLLRTGSSAAIEASIQILKGHTLNELETQLVYLSIGNAKHVNEEALKSATGLLDQQHLPKEIYLGVGALAGVYCRAHGCHTVKSDGIAALSQKLGAKLQNCKPKNKIEEDNVVAVLKGIRNIRHLEDSLIDKLTHCANDHNVKARVKVAALEAFLADPCSAKIKKTALDIMKNRQLDSEIRIKGYLAVIACPCGKSANEIKTLLESEPVHQVGRFITTSLRAIRSSSNADKRLAKQHYGLISTPNKFNVDDRKYSFFRESSYNVDALGVGGVLEQSVIYSQNSFLPRSASLNLTTQIFGHNFNVLELGGRQGNLDLVIEHFLGPKGLLNTEGPQAIYDIIFKAFTQSSEKVKGALNRGRRSVKSEIDGFDKNLKAEETHFDNELDLDVYVKLFGTDAVFLSLGDDKGFDYNKVLDKIIEAVNGGISKSQHMSTELRTHLLFLDAELSYPTSAGVPLRLDLTGAATARVELSTNLDIKQCITHPQNAKIDIKFVPSTDIEVTGTLIVDADAVATGLKVITNLHSSTGGHLVAKVLENGNGIDIQLGLPVEKQEILIASNDLVYITVEKGQKEKQTKIAVDGDRKEYGACFDQLSGLLGLTICSEVSLPFSVSGPEAQASISKYLARYPLSGKSRLSLVLEKNDMKGYHVRGLVRNENGKASLDLLFETEGNKNRRTHLIAERTYSDTEMGVKLSLDNPIQKVAGEFSLRNSPSELIAMAQADIGADHYYGKVGFNVAGSEQRRAYRPVLEYQMAGDEKRSVQVQGEVVRVLEGPQTKYTLQGLVIQMPNSQDSMNVQGFFSNQANARNMEWQLVSDIVTVKGNLKNNDLTMEFFNKLNPVVNFILKGHSEFGEVIKNEVDIIYGDKCTDQSRRFILSQFLKYKVESEKNFNVITKNKMEIVAIPFKISFDADIDPKKADVEFVFKNVDQKADFDLKARTQIKRPEDYSVKINANINKNGFEVLSKRDVMSNEKSNLENYIVVKGLGKYELSGIVLHKVQPNAVNVGFIGHVKISGGNKNEDIKIDVGMIQTTTLYSSHAKISASQGIIIDYLMKIHTGANTKGQLKFILKDAIAANGQFQVTDADGKGNGMLIVDFKKSQRKIKADAKFQAKKSVFNGDFDIYMNWEKDNKDKIGFSTNTKHTDKQLDSKNKLEYAGKTSEVNLNLNGELDVTGKSGAIVEVVLPTERCLTFKYDRDVNAKNGVYNGHANLILSDSPKRGAGGSTISYKAKMINTNLDKQTIDYEGQVELKLKDGKNLQNTFSLKNQAAGDDKFKFDFKTEVTGNAIPKAASLLTSATYIDSLTATDSTYRVKAAYGDDTNVDLVGTYIVQLEAEKDRKYLDDFTVSMRLPLEKAHDLKWISTLQFLQAQNKDEAEYTVVQALQVNAGTWKVAANGKIARNNGGGTVKVLVPHQDPFILDASYKANDGNDKKALYTEAKAKYGKGKSVSVVVDSSASSNGNSANIKISTPDLEKMKKLDISVTSKHPAPDTYSSSWVVDADGRVYKSEYTVVLSKAHPILDLSYTNPNNGKTSKIYVKGSSLSSTQGKLEVKIDNIRDISLDAITEANVQKDNVNFKVQANSNELGLKNFVGEIASKDAGSGKRLEFHSTNDNKNVLSGSTSFISKQEGQKTIIEGSGSVKVKEEQKSANFKYIRTLLTEGNEKGVETFFKVDLGERSYVAESRVTNLEYKNSHLYCEEKKQCANAELQSKIDISKPGVIANVIHASFDLRKLGVAPEVGLTMRDEVSTTKLPQYTLDLYADKDDRKYHLHVYNTPVFGHSKSGIMITLPSRTMVLENSVSYPTDKTLPFPIKGELVLDLDKTSSGHRAAARFLVDLEVDSADKQTAVAEFGFSHPKIGKEALVRFSGAAFRHGENTIKIETSAKVAHASLGKDREAKILFEVSPTHLNFLINTPLVKVIDVSASATMKEKLQKADVKFVLLEGKPVQVEFLVKDYQYYEFTTAEANRKLSIIGHIEPEKRVDISADIVLGGQKKNLLHGGMSLENNKVNTKYGLSQDNCNYFYKALRKDLEELETRVKGLGDKASNDFKDITRRVQPTLQKLEQSYADDLSKIYKEIADDKVLKEISHALHDIVQYFAQLMETIVKATKPIVDNISELYVDLATKIQEMYEKQIAPGIKQYYAIIAEGLKGYLDPILEMVAHVAATITDFLEKHKVELEELTNTIGEIFKDLTKLIVAQLKEYGARVSEIVHNVIEEIKNMPMIQNIKDQWNNMEVPERVLDLLKQAQATIRPLLPTPEAQAFSDTLTEYIIKKLSKQKCDDSKELRVVYQKLVTAVASLIQYVRNQLNQLGVSPVGPQMSLLNWTPVNAGSAPSLGGSASFSLLRQILTGDIPDLPAIIKAYRPRSLNPLNEIPSQLRAVIVQGQHIFTFDGRHLTFPGHCRYVLAHDFVDRNFTLLMQMTDGKPKALILEDKSGAIIELKENGQVTLNGANHGYPVEEKDAFAFRQANGRVGLGTRHGLMAHCSAKLEVCYIEVNGFYLGKLRGLLGDGNNEPFDDFRLPNGKISSSEAEFGNAYRLARSCPPVSVPEHSHHQMHSTLPAACEQVFGGTSPLRPLSLVLDIAPFRQACIHAVGSEQPAESLKSACELGAAYATLAVTGLLPAAMPEECLRCTDADKPRAIADTYTYKLPSKQADLVVAVEMTEMNEKTFKAMVVPIVSQVVDKLKAEQCGDVKVYLVGITSRFPYPVMYDTDIKLKNAKITFPDKTRYDNIKPIKSHIDPKVDEFIEQLVEVLNVLKASLGLSTIEASYAQLTQIPLRPGAVKHVISVVGEHCLPENFVLAGLSAGIYGAISENNAITHSLISITEEIKIGGGKNLQQVVGFNKNSVLLLGEEKPGKDAKALRESLEMKPDSFIEFMEDVDGMVFSSKIYSSLDAGQQKQYINTASGAISHAMLSQKLTQECTCSLADPFSARSVCINKDRAPLARRR